MIQSGQAAGSLLGVFTDWFDAHGLLTGKIALASTAVTILYAGLMFIVIARMSPDYFISKRPGEGSWRKRHPVIRFAVRGIKNVLGLLFVIAGVAMLVLPGQGALTILVGVCLLDFPGKRRLELKIVRQRPVLRAVNWIRIKAGRPPLVIPARETEERG
jgi:hypothetical protein